MDKDFVFDMIIYIVGILGILVGVFTFNQQLLLRSICLVGCALFYDLISKPMWDSMIDDDEID